jgi:hypothetical protein
LLQVLAFGGGLSATLKDSSLKSNVASSIVVVLANSTLTLQNTNVTHNRVLKGSVYASWSSRLVVEHSAIGASRAWKEGAGIYLVGSTGTVVKTALGVNVAEEGGGAVYIKFGRLLLNSSVVGTNMAPIGGGMAVCTAMHTSLL